jgi:hypothetical protein
MCKRENGSQDTDGKRNAKHSPIVLEQFTHDQPLWISKMDAGIIH